MKSRVYTLLALVSLVCAGCGTVKTIELPDRRIAQSVDVVISVRSSKVDVVCNGIACAGSVVAQGVTGTGSGPISANLGSDQAAVSALDRKLAVDGLTTQDVIFRSVQRAVGKRGIQVQQQSTREFHAFPSAPELFPATNSASANVAGILHIQVWSYGISRSASTAFRPAAMLKAYLLDRKDQRIVYSQIYSVGAETGGKVVHLGDTLPYFGDFAEVLTKSTELRNALNEAVDTVVHRILDDIRPTR